MVDDHGSWGGGLGDHGSLGRGGADAYNKSFGAFTFNYDQRHRIVTNIDFRYGSGNDYNGPVINLGKNADGSLKQIQLFANAGINMIANLGLMFLSAFLALTTLRSNGVPG